MRLSGWCWSVCEIRQFNCRCLRLRFWALEVRVLRKALGSRVVRNAPKLECFLRCSKSSGDGQAYIVPAVWRWSW